jgi:hypothetical protein
MANRVSFIIQLKNKFGPTAERINRQFQSMERNAEKLNKSLGKTGKEFKNLRDLGKKTMITGAAMSAAVTTPILLMSKSMINAASDATETANKFNSVFDDVESKANQVADNFSKNFGTAGSTARKLIGDTGDLLVGFGFSGDAALDLSKRVNELAADLTSFQNVQGGVPRASEALTKALLGETEMAKSLGIVIRQNDPAFKKQIKTVMRAQRVTEQQAKAIVILDIAMKQSQKAIGDVQRTWFDHASEVRRNEEAVKQMKESFGRLLIPAATKVTRILTRVVQWLDKLNPAWKTVILAVGGFLAVGGPLLVLLGGIAIAVSAISAPVLLVGAAILGLGAIIAAVALNWDKLVKFILAGTAKLLKKLSEFADVFGLDDISIKLERTSKALLEKSEAPSAPSGMPGGTLEGMITVAAEGGATVKNAMMASHGPGLNIGMNVPAGAQ